MRTPLLSIGISLLVISSASAQQLGSTLETGTNPVATSSSTQRIVNPQSPQDGNASLGFTYSYSACGLNYTTASQKIGQRFVISCCPATNGAVQPATFTIAGIPATAVIQKAFVWCDASGNGVPITLTVTNPALATSSVLMNIIGQDVDKCWGYSGTYSYRADVTACISGNGNYDLSGMPVDPSAASHSNDVDGATMMVIWSDPTQTWQGDINIWDGCVTMIGGTTTQTMTGFTACSGNVNNSHAFMIVADMQQLGSQLTLNGMPPIGVTEDWWNYIDVATTVTPSQSTATFGNNSAGDCYNFCMMGLYWQSNCSTCCANPFTLNMTTVPSQCSASNGTATATPVGGSGTFTYSWNSTPVQTTQTATGLPPGQYICTVVDAAGCTTVDTAIVMGTGSLPINNAQTDNLCHGDTSGTATITPTGGTGPFTYTWTPNVSTTNVASNLAAGTYTVNVTDAFGCQNSYTFTITEPPAVPINGSITGTSPICFGFSSGLTVSATGGAPPYSYSWINPPSASTSIIVSPTVTTTYSCVITDACNTPADTATFTVVVNQLPVITFSGDTLSGCAPWCVDFTASSNPALSSCTWDFGDNSTGTGANPSHCYMNAGSYNVTVHVDDVNGCKDSLTVPNYVNVYPNPIAGFNLLSPNPATLIEATISFDDISTGGDTCHWDFGDGHTLTVIGCGDVANSYADTGTYHVTQIVINQFGCSDTIDYDVYIIPYTTIYVPNTFTPNGDGKNDVFLAYGEYVADFNMMVFDRWGNLIFQSNDMQKGWDGKANGGKELAQIDTYVYVITYNEQYNGYHHKIIGHVNLIK